MILLEEELDLIHQTLFKQYKEFIIDIFLDLTINEIKIDKYLKTKFKFKCLKTTLNNF